MTPAALIAVAGCGWLAAAPPESAAPSGGVALAAGRPLARGPRPPSRPHADVFVAGMPAEPTPPVTRPAADDPDPPPVPAGVDVIFYARSRPVRVRVAVDGDRPPPTRWEQTLRELFAFFDRDEDGSLNRYELDQIIPVHGLRTLLAGQPYLRGGGTSPNFAAVDRDADGRVSFDEFARYCRRAGDEMLRAEGGVVPDGSPPALTEQLFARLDADKDGKLTRDELKAAERLLLALDADEDECVDGRELLGGPPLGFGERMDVAPASTSQDVAVYATGVPGSVVQQLIKRYDRDGDYKLTAAEVGFDAETFARLDVDRSGTLTAAELDAWRLGPPDAEATLSLGDNTPAATRAALTRPDGAAWPKGLAVREPRPGRAVLRVGTQTLDLDAFAPPPQARPRAARAAFTVAFPPGKAAVTEGDVAGPEFEPLRLVFGPADRNADGRLTKAEVDAYFALQRRVAEAGRTVAFASRTPNLFQMLDDNGDGRLGVRELRTAWDRLIALEADGATAVTAAVMQPSVTVRLVQARHVGVDAAVFSTGAAGPRSNAAVPARGPVWFRKMDRNADGDVSRAEFLGDAAAFAAADADGDGLLSADEAVAFDKKTRKE